VGLGLWFEDFESREFLGKMDEEREGLKLIWTRGEGFVVTVE